MATSDKEAEWAELVLAILWKGLPDLEVARRAAVLKKKLGQTAPEGKTVLM